MRHWLLLSLIIVLYVPARGQMKVSYPEGMPAASTLHAADTAMRPLAPVRPAPIAYDLRSARTVAEVGITDPFLLSKADALVENALRAGAFPGCRVLAAKWGKIFYDKSFGRLSYDSAAAPVTAATVYDLASLTKVVSTTLAVMHLSEGGKIDLDKRLGDYLPMTLGTDKAAIPLRALLLHQAGLKAWIPFYKSFYDSSGRRLLDTAFRASGDKHYNIEVAKNLWLRGDYRDTIWKMILASPLENAGRYVYSDLDYYFLAAVVEKVTGKPLNRYVADQFYTPLGLKMTGYLPLGFIKPALIAPTEADSLFRHQLLTGYVHDPGAALFGGVAGHAGVFSTAGDVAVIFQMLLNEGRYHGKVYFMPETVRRFTAYGSPISRRGLGFDKPTADRFDGGPTATQCSGYTFGHQGFTGTCAWADPQTGVVFVFLSNRVYPNAENGLINKLSTRTTVQRAIYDALAIPDDTMRVAVKKAAMDELR